VVARSNDHYGIPDRQFVTHTSKAKTIDQTDLQEIAENHVRLSLELQKAFGLRREEATSFSRALRMRSQQITQSNRLKASWTKGGKERSIPIRNEEQRTLLERIKREVGNGSLIPADRNYVQQLRIYERQTANAGLSRMHGLRHAYVQQRYQELTGWLSSRLPGDRL
ncbi:MAG: integrase domain-containing protein, partial [Chromatiales bacterium]|nr:integrase domain-containing protein [Chromatiales bacterium]